MVIAIATLNKDHTLSVGIARAKPSKIHKRPFESSVSELVTEIHRSLRM